MNAAILFNSSHPTLGGLCGTAVMERLLGVGVLDRANRHLRVSIGDILTYNAAASSHSPTSSYLVSLCRKVYLPNKLDLIISERLNLTFGHATVFCWLFENTAESIMKPLHKGLVADPAYLGAMDVDFSDALHLRFFRNSLSEAFSLRGRECYMFYAMGQNEDPDLAVKALFELHGFKVSYEDTGALLSG